MSRGTPILILLAAIVAVVAALRLLGSGERSDPAWLATTDSAGAAQDVVVAAEQLAAVDSNAARVATTAEHPRDAVSSPSSASGATLHGFVRASRPSYELSEGSWVRLTSRLGESWRTKSDHRGWYAFADLAPGRYWLRAGSSRDGQASAVAEVVGDTQVDLLLVPDAEILVRVLDRTGKSLLRLGLLAVATREPPGEWFEEVWGSWNNPFGVGRFLYPGGEESVPEGCLGKVVLDVEPPVHVSLVAYQRVVATQRVETGQREVVFVLDADDPLLAKGGLRFQVADKATGAPIETANAMVDGHGSRFLTRVGSTFEVDGLPPGSCVLRVMARDHESVALPLRIEPGEVKDVGVVELGEAVSIRGTLVDPDGRGVQSKVRYDLRAEDGSVPRRPGSIYGAKSDESGAFEIGALSRHQYVLRGMPGDESGWAEWSRVVDLREGSVTDLRIQLVRGVPLVVAPTRAAASGLTFRVLDPTGAVVVSRKLTMLEPTRVLIAPGSYDVEVVESAGAEARRIPIHVGEQPVVLELP